MECPAPIEKWLIIYPRRLYDQIDAFANKMNQVSRNLGIIMKPPRWVEIDSDRSGDYADALKKSLAMKPNMVFSFCCSWVGSLLFYVSKLIALFLLGHGSHS